MGFMRLSAQRNYAEFDKPHCQHYVVALRKQASCAVGTGDGNRRGVRPSVVRHEFAQSGRERGSWVEWASTRKDFRPEACQPSAFANFATPAPRTATNQAILSAKTHTLTATAVPQCQCSENHLIAIIVLLRELAFSDGRTSYELWALGFGLWAVGLAL